MSAEAAFAPFLDAATMQGLLSRRLPALVGERALLCDLRLLHAWRKTYARPGKAHRSWLSVCYEMELARSPSAPVERVLLHGRAEPDADGERAAAAGGGWPLRLSTSMARIELRLFPDDPAMPQLASLFAPRRSPLGGGDPRPLHARVVSYRPGERCTLALEDAAGRPRAFAKTFADPARATAVAARLAAVARGLGARGAATLQVPALLRTDLAAPGGEAAHTVWTEACGGEALVARRDDPESHRALALVATALAELHATPVAGLPRAERATRLLEARRKLRKLAGVFPEASAAAASGLVRCEALLEDAGLRAVALDCTRHGDVHPGQFLLRRGRVALFDFDELARGDLEEDLVALAVALDSQATSLAVHAAAGDDDPAGARLAWQAPDVASTWLPALLAAHVASGRAPRAPQAGLVELHWRLQWLDRAYRSFWRHGGGAAAVIRRALHAVAAPFDGGGAVA